MYFDEEEAAESTTDAVARILFEMSDDLYLNPDDEDMMEDFAKQLAEALAMQYDNFKVHHYMGQVQAALGYEKIAEECFKEALRLNPAEGYIYSDWADLYENEDDDAPEQFEIYIKATQDCPEYIGAWQWLMMKYNFSRQKDKAKALMEEMLERLPNNDQICKTAAGYYMGEGLWERPEYESALELYNKAIDIAPQKYEHYFSRYYIFSNIGRHEEALRDLDKYIALRSYSSASEYLYINTYAALKDYDRALAIAEHYMVTNNYNEISTRYRAEVYMKMGEWDLAIADFKSAMKKKPKDKYAMFDTEAFYKYEIAIANYKKGNKKEGWKQLEECLKTKQSDYTLLRFSLTKVEFLMEENKKEQALAFLEEIEARYARALSVDWRYREQAQNLRETCNS